MKTTSLSNSIWLAALVVSLLAGLTHAQRRGRNRFPPISNSEFYGKVTKSTVTERFEIYDPHSREELQIVKNMGFDQVILDRAPLHLEAAEVGLDVVIANWWTHETEQQQIDDMLELCRKVQPGRLVGVSVMDEPERNSPDTEFAWYIDLYKDLKPRMRDELEGVPLEISYWGPLAAWDQRYYEQFSYLYESADVMRLMPYPDLQEGPLEDVYLMMRRSDRAMSLASDVDIPKTVILQTWILPPKNQLPTIDELRVMAYQAMLGGAKTLSFFEYRPEVWDKFPGFEEDFEGLMQELTGLRTRLRGAEIESRLEETGILHAVASWTSGETAEIRVNTNRQAMDDLVGLEIVDPTLEMPLPESAQPSFQQEFAQGGSRIEPSLVAPSKPAVVAPVISPALIAPCTNDTLISSSPPPLSYCPEICGGRTVASATTMTCGNLNSGSPIYSTKPAVTPCPAPTSEGRRVPCTSSRRFGSGNRSLWLRRSKR